MLDAYHYLFVVNAAFSRSTSRYANLDNSVVANNPLNAATIPAIVGIVACDTPAAIDRGFPVPENAITSNTTIIPVTVPSNPSNGHNATIVLINGKNVSMLIDTREIIASRIRRAFQDRRSDRASHVAITSRTTRRCAVRK